MELGADAMGIPISGFAPDGFGWRTRIGLIYMASSVVMEPEFCAMAPAGVSVHTTRLRLPTVTVAGLVEMAESKDVEECARLLAEAPLDVLIFGGTSASFIHGKGWDEAMMARMRRVSKGIPVTTTSTALLSALHSLGIRRVVFATPYLDEVTQRGVSFLEENGISVTAWRGLQMDEDRAIGSVEPATVYRLVKNLDRADAEAAVISCTNLRTIGVIRSLEEDLGKPVVSAIQASLWHCLRLAGVRGGRREYGSLFGIPCVDLVRRGQ
jgi:maleate isomerase